MISTTAKTTSALRARPFLGAASVVALFVALWMALIWSPPDVAMGSVVRILYVHVANAWLAYLAFVVVFLASVGWLWTRNALFDAVAVGSAEIGVLFTGLFLVAGSIWAKPTWGVWWTWEPRLVTTAIMFVMYVGYLLLRGLSTDFSRRATRAAVFGFDVLGLVRRRAFPCSSAPGDARPRTLPRPAMLSSRLRRRARRIS